jgi:hypothetical protein
MGGRTSSHSAACMAVEIIGARSPFNPAKYTCAKVAILSRELHKTTSTIEALYVTPYFVFTSKKNLRHRIKMFILNFT